MRNIALFAILVLAGCANTQEFARKDQLVSLRAEIMYQNVRHEATEKAERLERLEKENNRFERILGFVHQLALDGKRYLKLVGQLQDETVMRFAETAQVRKDLADVCALLRKHHKIRKDHICSSGAIKKLQSNPATENETILEEFNKKVKRIEQRRKKK